MAGAQSVTTTMFIINHMAVIYYSFGTSIRAMAMIVTSSTIGVAARRVQSSTMAGSRVRDRWQENSKEENYSHQGFHFKSLLFI